MENGVPIPFAAGIYKVSMCIDELFVNSKESQYLFESFDDCLSNRDDESVDDCWGLGCWKWV